MVLSSDGDDEEKQEEEEEEEEDHHVINMLINSFVPGNSICFMQTPRVWNGVWGTVASLIHIWSGVWGTVASLIL